ncbi:hypothetical protein TH63_04305 [Rufibacter radiotolerans]|uniref:Uncharacterized protein n=1 Tax=Rufibacter radiotolerans TaxID=1379910 RepID=A0A0H4VMA7_9BACT|nr:hypothetical protein [Rufibacter radiotolerans]AKQ45027.1 hypothetical protein TH63_04305 [Rufibacter radiotolerans]
MKLDTEIKILSWYQIIGGFIGLVILIHYILQTEAFNGYAVLFLFAMLMLFLFSIACGLILLKNPTKGMLPSRINQILQIIGFAVAGYSFQYISGLGVIIGFDLTEGMLLKLNAALSSFEYNWNTDHEEAFLVVNIVPLVVIYLLNKIENELQQEKTSLELTKEQV